MTKRQAKIAAQFMTIFLLWEAVDNPDEYFEGLFDERLENRLTMEDQDLIMIEMKNIAQDLVGKGIRLTNVQDIIKFAKKS